nr:hypothetical protein [Tanacetum cinerariifolium]
MRIEQYFLMTDYSLWEVILNRDSLAPTRVIEGVLQLVTPTTAEQKLARKNKLKARDVNLKFLRSLPSEWKTHTLIWRNKADLKEQSLDDLFNSLKIYEAKVKNSSSTGTTTQNLAFVSSSNTNSTTESVSVAASVSAICAKMPMSSLPNVDSLSNASIYSFFASQSSSPQLDNKDLKQIDSDDLKEMELKWQMAMLTMRLDDFFKGHFTRKCRSPKDLRRNGAAEPHKRNVPVETSTSNVLVSQCDGVGSMTGVFKQRRSLPIMLLWPSHLRALLLIMRDNALVTLKQKLKKAKQKRDGLTLELEKFQTSSKNLIELLASQTNEKTGLGYKSQVFTRAMFECDDYLSSESVESWPPTHTAVETDHSTFNVQLSPPKPDQDLSHTNRPTASIIEDWVSDFEDESETKAPQIVPDFVQSTEQVKSPRPSVQHAETSIPAATPKPASPNHTSNGKRRNRKACFVCKSLDHLIKDCDYHEKKMAQTTTKNHAHRDQLLLLCPKSSPFPKTSNSPPRVTAVKAPVVSAAQGLQGKCGCSRHMTGNMSYLSDFEELNGEYVAFGGNQKGGKISREGKIKTEELDFDDVYFIKELKFNLFSVS